MVSYIKAVLAGLRAVIEGLFNRPKGLPYLVYVVCRASQAMIASRSPSDYEFKPGPSTLEVYNTFTSKKGIQPNVVEIGSGLNGLWLGSPTAKTVMLFFHGGGYRDAASPAHYDVLQSLIKAANRQQKELSVLVVAYNLSYQSPYPKQLQQSAEALNYLLTDAKFDPRNIIVAGDSAGGHLTLSLLGHLIHHHPSVVVPDLKGHKLLGNVTVSPWVAFEHKGPHATRNANFDLIPADGVGLASQKFLNGAPTDEYNTPSVASADWWQGCPVQQSLFTAGEYETFVDDVEVFFNKFKVHNPRSEIFVGHAEIHDQPVIANALGCNPPETYKYLEQWLLNLLA